MSFAVLHGIVVLSFTKTNRLSKPVTNATNAFRTKGTKSGHALMRCILLEISIENERSLDALIEMRKL